MNVKFFILEDNDYIHDLHISVLVIFMPKDSKFFIWLLDITRYPSFCIPPLILKVSLSFLPNKESDRFSNTG